MFYFAETPFQDGQAPSVLSPRNGGVVAQAVKDVTASGALYFSSAGNSGNKNDGTSGVWEGDFVDGGPLPSAVAAFESTGRVHMFPGGLTTDLVTATGSSQYNLNWSDPLGASSNDYDLFAIDSTGAVIAAYTMTGALSPVRDGGTYNAGRTLPVKFKLTGASAVVTNAVARLWVAKVTNGAAGPEAAAATASNATTGNLFRFDPTDRQYVFDWNTAGLAPGAYCLRIDTGDGVQRLVNVTLN